MYLLLFALLWLPLAQAEIRPAPEIASGWEQKPLVRADKAMVVTANAYASQAGADMLAAGGSAVDAMIAAQLVLGLVEPQSSGLGGGGFLVHWQQESGELTTLDGRETAPRQAPAELFLKDGQPMAFMDAVVGGRSVGTPGTVKLMWEAHQRFGILPWQRLFAPAIKLALNGFPVSPRLARQIAKSRESLLTDPQARAYFFDDQSQPLRAGDIRTNPMLAALLTRLSVEGPSAFYQGKIAQLMVDKVRSAAAPGHLALEDLEHYRVQERAALCFPYRRYKICGMGPPSSGTLALGQILGMLSHFPLSEMGPGSASAWRLIADASRLAFADRHHYAADNDFVPVPVTGLLDPAYLESRVRLLRETSRALPAVAPGIPPGWSQPSAADDSIEFPSTTHVSIIDASGNAVSLTSTIENAFGSRLMVQGFLLNNELTDFAFSPSAGGVPVANRLQPGKRPRSSMTPTLVFENDQLLLVVGSPGGSSIIGYVLHTLLNVLDWGMNIREALHQPHVLHKGRVLELEPRGRNLALQPAMAALGFDTRFTELNSGLHGILRRSDGLAAAADPRREGVALAADPAVLHQPQ